MFLSVLESKNSFLVFWGPNDFVKNTKNTISTLKSRFWVKNRDFAQNVPNFAIRLRMHTKIKITKQKKTFFHVLGQNHPFLIPFCAVFLFLRT